MPNVDTVSLQHQQQYRETSEEENVLLQKSTKKEQQSTNRRSLSLSFIMPAKVMDQTMTTVSLSMEDYDEGKDDYDVEERMVLSAMPPSRIVWKDDCEPPSPIRKLTTQQAQVVVLNTRHSLLEEETDTDGEDEEEEVEAAEQQQEDDNEQDYHEQLTKLNFRLEMEEHAREAAQVLLIPEMPGTEAAMEVAPSVPMKISPCKSEQEEPPEPVTTVSTQKVSILESMTVGFVDTLCLPRKVCGTRNPTLPTSTTTTSAPVEYENSLQQDFLQILGCSNPPDDDEIAHLWDVDVDTALQLSCALPSESPRRLTYPPIPERPTGPHRPGPRERVMRLRKWRRERSLGAPAFPDRTYSMDIGSIDEAWRQQPYQEDLTYDSDPEMSVSMRGRRSCQKKTTTKCPTTPKRRSSTYRWMVRESMNQNWDLKTW